MSNGSIGNVPGTGTLPSGGGNNFVYQSGTGISQIDDIYSQNQFFNEVNAVWPELSQQQAFISPPRNGMDRKTGQLLQGWDHVLQSMEIIFETPYHERVLRRWVGSFVPRLLGENIIYRIISRFWWAIAEALDLWEPNFRIKQVLFMGNALSQGLNPVILQGTSVEQEIRVGHVVFQQSGVYRPRAHLGDLSPYELRYFGAISRGGDIWDLVALGSA